MIRKYLTTTVLVFLVAVGVQFFSNNLDVAAETKGTGLGLSPLRNELELLPGTSYTGMLDLYNDSGATKKIRLEAEEFSVVNTAYDYKFKPESGASKWISFDKNEIELDAGQKFSIEYTLGVPLMSEPGGYYITIFATDIGSLDSSLSVNYLQRIGSLIYLNVSGDVTRHGELVLLNSPWATADNVRWGVNIQNSGSTHFRSLYSATLTSLFSSDVISKTSGDSLVLPGTVRYIDGSIEHPFWPGVYKIEFDIGLGDNPAYKESKYVLFIPVAWLIAIGLLLFVIFYRYSLRRIILKTK